MWPEETPFVPAEGTRVVVVFNMNRKNINGFTLVELLLYSVILGSLVFGLVGAAQVFLRTRARAQVIEEVDEQGLSVLRIITQITRNASAINSPGTNSSGASLSLNVPTAGLSPAKFALNNGAVTMVEGGNSVVNLTSAKVTVTGLSFSNLSGPGTPGNVRIQFTLGFNNPDGNADYTYSKNFIGSASLR